MRGRAMHKTIDSAISETAGKMAAVINESGLPLSILKLLLTNTLYQLQQIQEHNTEGNGPERMNDEQREI